MPFNPTINDGLPHFLDRADGTNYGAGAVGAPTPAGAIVIQSPNSGTDYQIQEDVDSPTLERAEQATITKSFHDLSWTDAITRIQSLGRGGILIDRYGNQIRILSSTIQSQRGNKATLKIISEGLSFDTPPDEFSITPVELGINIIKHPRYFYSLLPDPQNDDAIVQAVKQSIVRAVQTYQDSPFFPTAATLAGMLNGQVQDNIMAALKTGNCVLPITNINYEPQFSVIQDLKIQTASNYNNGNPVSGFYLPAATKEGDVNDPYVHVAFQLSAVSSGDLNKINMAMAAALELISKLWKIEDNPYIVGFEVNWSVYYYRPQYINPGGYLENPMSEANPALPDYFYSPDNPPDTVTTFFDLLAQYNPQCYSSTGDRTGIANWSCLRKSDSIEYQRTWFKHNRSWLCSAIGMWDTDINSSGNRPSLSNSTIMNGRPSFGYNILV